MKNRTMASGIRHPASGIRTGILVFFDFGSPALGVVWMFYGTYCI